jgi:hypothetical protein
MLSLLLRAPLYARGYVFGIDASNSTRVAAVACSVRPKFARRGERWAKAFAVLAAQHRSGWRGACDIQGLALGFIECPRERKYCVD